MSSFLYPLISETRKETFFGQLLAAEFFPDKNIQIKGFIEECLLNEFRKRYNAENPSTYFRNIIKNKVWGGNNGLQWHLEEAQKDPALDKYRVWRDIQLKEIKSFLSHNPEIKQIVEIGCGNGLYLNQMASELESGYNLIGIDLSEEQIKWNRLHYPDISFQSGNAEELIVDMKRGGILYFTFGTLICFSESELISWLNKVFHLDGKQAICLSEWNINYDIQSETRTKAISPTLYNHAYHHLVTKAGFIVKDLIYTDASERKPGYVRTFLIAQKP